MAKRRTETPKRSEHETEKERCMMVCPAAFNREHHCPGRLGEQPTGVASPWLHHSRPLCARKCVNLCARVRARVCLCERASEQVSEWKKMTTYVSEDKKEVADFLVLIPLIHYSFISNKCPESCVASRPLTWTLFSLLQIQLHKLWCATCVLFLVTCSLIRKWCVCEHKKQMMLWLVIMVQWSAKVQHVQYFNMALHMSSHVCIFQNSLFLSDLDSDLVHDRILPDLAQMKQVFEGNVNYWPLKAHCFSFFPSTAGSQQSSATDQHPSG